MTQWLGRTLVAALIATTASGCTLYFGDDGDDDCLFGGADAAAQGLRNPETNQCEFIGGGGGGCGQPVPAADLAGAPAPVDWAQCFTACEGLDEQSCFAAPECRATYQQTDPSQGGFRVFSGCVGVAPSGPVTGEACQGLDAYGCSRHDDCVAVYGTTDVPNDGYSGSGVFTSCEPEPGSQGCFSSNDCPTGYTCTTEQGACDPPPGCDPSTGQACPPVCFGQCIPSGGSCAAIDCGPGFHCEETCTGGGPMPGSGGADSPVPPDTCTATCVPDQQMCPIECPPDSVCVEVCPPCNYPGDPQCGAPCHFECQGQPPSVCEGFDCGPDAHCEAQCFPCDPLPDGTGCENACQPFCVPNPPTDCTPTTCAPGSHCEVQCTPVDPTDPAGPMGGCTATCVPDPTQGCAVIDCQPGFHCEETCLPQPCMDPAGCPDLCRGECLPDGPGQCGGIVVCDSLPPACPTGTEPGVLNGCWSGYCIPTSQCGDPPPTSCESITDEMTCASRAECAPIYTGVCTPNPDGTWTCMSTVFTRCESRVMPF